jgi:hypothetical protein
MDRIVDEQLHAIERLCGQPGASVLQAKLKNKGGVEYLPCS